MASRNKDAYVVPELRIERERSRLVLEELTNLLDGGAELTKTRKNIRKHFRYLIRSAEQAGMQPYHARPC